MNIKRYDVKLDTQYELRLLNKFDEELEYDYDDDDDDDDKNFNPFSLEDTVKLYMKYEKKHKPGQLIIKQIVEKTVPKKTVDGIAQRLKYNL